WHEPLLSSGHEVKLRNQCSEQDYYRGHYRPARSQAPRRVSQVNQRYEENEGRSAEDRNQRDAFLGGGVTSCCRKQDRQPCETGKQRPAKEVASAGQLEGCEHRQKQPAEQWAHRKVFNRHLFFKQHVELCGYGDRKRNQA